MIKVSVVVPTYQTPPEGLTRLVGSLDRQTLPTSEFEVIFVDDGSPDDTLQRLRGLQSTHRNVRVEAIENSGWPSKPRNVGIDLARGEYVAFMDHDDELYPDALRAAYEFAAAHRADVVSGKESRTTDPGWALGSYDVDRPQAKGREDVHPLLPMNPHKLYRKAFLDQHGIRFPEGRRVLWEDIFFNLQVARDAKVVSSLASVPYYHWVTTEGSGSTTFLKSNDDYWEWLRRVCSATVETLPGEENRMQREQLELHQYNSRVVGAFDLKFTERSERNKKFIFEHAAALQADYGYRRLDSRLTVSRRLRAELLHAGRQDLIETVCALDAAVPGWGSADAVQWRDGVLHVEGVVEWADSSGRRPALRRMGSRIVKDLPQEVLDAVSSDAIDVTREIDAIELTAFGHSRQSRVAWALETTSEVSVEDRPDGTVGIAGRMRFSIDPRRAAFGRPLDSGSHWDIRLHTRFGSATTARAVKSAIPASVSVADGHLHLVYPNDGGAATLIPDGQQEAVRRLSPTAASLEGGDLVISLDGRHDGSGSVDASVGEWKAGAAGPRATAATLTVKDGHALLRIPGPHPDVRELRIGDRAPGGATSWSFRRRPGGVDMARTARTAQSARPTAKPAAPTLRRKVGKVLRKLGLR
ncbi:glycosyltransferase [Microbacterium sp. NPDC080220]|uniref:glycosyltransferase n=1 Tax=Microbacterium sp. NPDC080220 TaxID=3161017 RepID=UPI00341AF1A9